MKRKFLMPSALGMALMLCLLFVQATGMRSTSTSLGLSGDATATGNYGLPPMLQLEWRGPSEATMRVVSFQVHWKVVAIVLAIAWCVAMPIGRWITGYLRRDGSYAGPPYTGVRHPAAIISFVLAGCLMVSVICAVALPPLFPTGAGTFGDFVFGFYMLLMILAVPITVIVMIVRRWRYRSRIVQRGFEVEMPPVPAAQV